MPNFNHKTQKFVIWRLHSKTKKIFQANDQNLMWFIWLMFECMSAWSQINVYLPHLNKNATFRWLTDFVICSMPMLYNALSVSLFILSLCMLLSHLHGWIVYLFVTVHLDLYDMNRMAQRTILPLLSSQSLSVNLTNAHEQK